MVYLFADVSKKVILISLNIEVPFETRLQTSVSLGEQGDLLLDVLLKTRLQTSLCRISTTLT